MECTRRNGTPKHTGRFISEKESPEAKAVKICWSCPSESIHLDGRQADLEIKPDSSTASNGRKAMNQVFKCLYKIFTSITQTPKTEYRHLAQFAEARYHLFWHFAARD